MGAVVNDSGRVAAARAGSIGGVVTGAVVIAAAVVPLVLAVVAAVLTQRMAVDARLARGQHVASATATLIGVARESASLADLDTVGASINAAIDDEVDAVVVRDNDDNPLFVAMAPTVDAAGLSASLERPQSGSFVVDAEVRERDRQSGTMAPIARVQVRLRAPEPPLVLLFGIMFLGVVASIVVVAVTLRRLRKRAFGPLFNITSALQRAAAGDVAGALAVVDDARSPWQRPLAEIDTLTDAFDALLRATREREGLKAQLAQGMGEQVASRGAFSEQAPRVADVAVVVVDVRDFTALQASLSPELAVAFVDRLLTAFVLVVERHGGHVERFLADGIVALFGAPNASADAVVRAAACAVDLEVSARHLVEAERALGTPRFVVGVGVAAGKSPVGVVGPPSRRAFMALGEVPARAKKIQQEAKSQALGVLVDDVVYAAAKDALPHTTWKKLPPLVVRGVGVPLTLYRPQRVARDNDDVTAMIMARRP